MNLSEQPDAGKDSVKKPYTKPQVQIYGDLREITQTIAASKNTADGGTQGSPKT